MLSALVLTSLLSVSPVGNATVPDHSADFDARPLNFEPTAPEAVFVSPVVPLDLAETDSVLSGYPITVIRGQGPALTYDEEPVQSDLGVQQFSGAGPVMGAPWNPMAPVWPGNPMLAPNGMPGGPAPFMSVPGLNGAKPFQFGWTRRADVGFLPKERVTGGGGQFGAFEFNTEFRYTAPLPTQWVMSLAPQYSLRTWDGPGAPALPGDVHRFGLDLNLTSPTVGPFTAELGFNPSLNTDFDHSPGSDAWNWDGRGALLIRTHPQWLAVVGAMFWDRVDDQVLPYGGLVYTPSDFVEIRAMFPRADINFFIGTPWGVPQWLYVAGEYHVEAYEIGAGGPQRKVEMEDWRVLLGVRSDAGGFTSFLEGGWVFDREIKFNNPPGGPTDISSGFIVRFGVRF